MNTDGIKTFKWAGLIGDLTVARLLAAQQQAYIMWAEVGWEGVPLGAVGPNGQVAKGFVALGLWNGDFSNAGTL